MDKYDRAIETIKAAPNFRKAAVKAWMNGGPRHPEGCLFQFLSDTGHCLSVKEGRHSGYGCLSLVKLGKGERWQAWTDEMTQKILADPRVPEEENDITPETLEVFAEYQREADATFRKPQPEAVLDARD